MLHSENTKVVAELPTAAVGATASATLTIDTLGYDHASISVLRAGNSDTNFANVVKVEESDSSGSGYGNITALVGGGTGGFSVPAASASTSTTNILKMDVDCKAKKRYLKVTYTPGVTATVGIVAHLSRGEVAPSSASQAGVIGLVKG
jgi:hypothetical protein